MPLRCRCRPGTIGARERRLEAIEIAQERNTKPAGSGEARRRRRLQVRNWRDRRTCASPDRPAPADASVASARASGRARRSGTRSSRFAPRRPAPIQPATASSRRRSHASRFCDVPERVELNSSTGLAQLEEEAEERAASPEPHPSARASRREVGASPHEDRRVGDPARRRPHQLGRRRLRRRALAWPGIRRRRRARVARASPTPGRAVDRNARRPGPPSIRGEEQPACFGRLALTRAARAPGVNSVHPRRPGLAMRPSEFRIGRGRPTRRTRRSAAAVDVNHSTA